MKRLRDFLSHSMYDALFCFLIFQKEEPLWTATDALISSPCYGGRVGDEKNLNENRKQGGTNAMWKKHETFIEEKIVTYITKDEDGTMHKLVETEKRQNDIVHMECKGENGESAHREYTQEEQTETFDENLVVSNVATEEYVHFKNDVDEYEFVFGQDRSESPSNQQRSSQHCNGDKKENNDTTSNTNNEPENSTYQYQYDDDDWINNEPNFNNVSTSSDDSSISTN